jgi:hypothetical protein
MKDLLIVLLVPALALATPLLGVAIGCLIVWVNRFRLRETFAAMETPEAKEQRASSDPKRSDDETLPLWTWFLPNPCPNREALTRPPALPKSDAHFLADSYAQRNRLTCGE